MVNWPRTFHMISLHIEWLMFLRESIAEGLFSFRLAMMTMCCSWVQRTSWPWTTETQSLQHHHAVRERSSVHCVVSGRLVERLSQHMRSNLHKWTKLQASTAASTLGLYQSRASNSHKLKKCTVERCNAVVTNLPQHNIKVHRRQTEQITNCDLRRLQSVESVSRRWR